MFSAFHQWNIRLIGAGYSFLLNITSKLLIMTTIYLSTNTSTAFHVACCLEFASDLNISPQDVHLSFMKASNIKAMVEASN